MTITTTRAAIGTKVTAVVLQEIPSRKHIARSVRTGIVSTRTSRMNAPAKLSRANVATLTSATECAMMLTTTLAATGTKVIAAVQLKPSKPRIVLNANAKIAKPMSKSARRQGANADHQTGKGTRTVTTTTITAVVGGTKVNVVVTQTKLTSASSV